MDSPLSKLQQDLNDPQAPRRRVEPEELQPLKKQPSSSVGWGALQSRQPEPKEEEVSATPSKYNTHLNKMFIGSMLFFLIALVVAGLLWFFEWGAVSSRNIELNVSGSQELTTSASSTMTITINNKNRRDLIDARLVVLFPAETQSIDGEELIRYEKPLGDIVARGNRTESVTYVPFGNTGDEIDILIRLEYHVEGSDSPFSTELPFDARIASSPLTLAVTAPQRIALGEEAVFGITLTSASPQTRSDVIVQAQLPPEFRILSSDHPTYLSSGTWKFDRLEPRERTIITFKGVVDRMPASGTSRMVVAVGYEQDEKKGELFQKVLHEVKIIPLTEPPVSLTISVPDNRLSSQGTFAGSEPIPVTLLWNNTSGEVISEPLLTLGVSGGYVTVDPSSLGQLSPDSLSITWRASDLGMTALQSPSSGSVKARLHIIPSQQQPLRITGSLQGRKSGGATSKLTTVQREFNRTTATNLTTSVRRVSGSLSGFGPYPPLAGTETGHVLIVRVNPALPLHEAKVKVLVPDDVRIMSNPQVSQGTATVSGNEIIWEIGTIRDRAVSQGESYSFQVVIGHTPTLDDVGSVPSLTLSTTLSESIGGIDSAVVTNGPVQAVAEDSEARPVVRRSQ